ncbi:rhodanese-like domain-containing protein [Algoriphagus sediminis]|uniref:Rhodanese-like domain-containing protein n=1 Tax=Algoriphagus sediminis TaxID=3057113 RepID=A0ABT7YA38_9BACT|nr:rhodanese-like domain-containing protein [Algoriphagus sediminis]MDN3203389.1 rhodanese-like domain-containing protein [Algoriphagus sediminis]
MFNIFQRTEKKYKDINSEDFLNEMTSSNAVVIDVRMPAEVSSGKIPGARNINIMGNFKGQVQNLPKDKKYLIYCRSGNRSASACQIMGDLGFEDVSNLRGGIISWPYDLA